MEQMDLKLTHNNFTLNVEATLLRKALSSNVGEEIISTSLYSTSKNSHFKNKKAAVECSTKQKANLHTKKMEEKPLSFWQNLQLSCATDVNQRQRKQEIVATPVFVCTGH